jgi:hypothetical protein
VRADQNATRTGLARFFSGEFHDFWRSWGIFVNSAITVVMWILIPW